MTPAEQAAFDQGFAAGKAEAAELIRQLQAALNKALAENLAKRAAPVAKLSI